MAKSVYEDLLILRCDKDHIDIKFMYDFVRDSWNGFQGTICDTIAQVSTLYVNCLFITYSM